jgi:hypothetical protein
VPIDELGVQWLGILKIVTLVIGMMDRRTFSGEETNSARVVALDRRLLQLHSCLVWSPLGDGYSNLGGAGSQVSYISTTSTPTPVDTFPNHKKIIIKRNSLEKKNIKWTTSPHPELTSDLSY